MSRPLWGLSACELAEGMRARRFSCAEVMTSVVERIRSRNDAINAIVYDYTEQAIAAAHEADAD
ncbi:MAG: amidase, partial [Candidatus Tectomicrobia bacterium]